MSTARRLPAALVVVWVLVGVADGQSAAKTDRTPVIKMGVNDSRSGTISPRGDVDRYEFTITKPGIFQFAIRNIPKAVTEGEEIAALDMLMTGPKAYRWGAFTKRGERSFTLPPTALAAGTYQLRIKDYFDDAASADSYLVQTIFAEVNDPGEPNNTPSQAARLKSGHAATGYILPADDKDYYKMQLLAPGRVKITVSKIPAEIRDGAGTKALYLAVFDKASRLLREATSRPRQETLETDEEVMNVGTYFVVVRDFRSDNFGSTPYTITATFPGLKGELSGAERELLDAVTKRFQASDDALDTEERDILERLETRFLED